MATTFARAVDRALEATIVLSFSRVGHAVRSRTDAWPPVAELPGRGRHAVVTGANSGLGFATARHLLRAGADVTVLARTSDKAADTVARLRDEVGPAARVRGDHADLADLDQVRAVGDRLRAALPSLDVLVHNAGAMFDRFGTTRDGLERTYQLHVVAPHLLTWALRPALAAAGPGRVLWVTSGGMYAERLDVDQLRTPTSYRPAAVYARAKRAQVSLAERWDQVGADEGPTAASVHPGWALTPGVERSMPRFRRLAGPILRDADAAADPIAWLALTPREDVGGRLWHDRQPRPTHRLRRTRAPSGETDRLWDQVHRDAGLR